MNQAPSTCQCGTQFLWDRMSKRRCPACMQRLRQRRAISQAAPRCAGCPQGLGIDRVAAGIRHCPACERRLLEQRRQHALNNFADQLIRRGYA